LRAPSNQAQAHWPSGDALCPPLADGSAGIAVQRASIVGLAGVAESFMRDRYV
jgi:hypothetical protein